MNQNETNEQSSVGTFNGGLLNQKDLLLIYCAEPKRSGNRITIAQNGEIDEIYPIREAEPNEIKAQINERLESGAPDDGRVMSALYREQRLDFSAEDLSLFVEAFNKNQPYGPRIKVLRVGPLSVAVIKSAIQ